MAEQLADEELQCGRGRGHFGRVGQIFWLPFKTVGKIMSAGTPSKGSGLQLASRLTL